MAVTAKGFQGTVSDVDMATQLGAHHIPTVRSAADLAVSAVASNRRVSVAVGVADSAFVKVTNDAALPIDLAPPASGGKWYAITVNRQWSPSNTVAIQADDLAVSDTNGTVPASIPTAALTAANALADQPGTAGSTSGQRQVLALVYVRAADTTLTIFDLRMIRTGAGVLTASTVHALAYVNGKLLDGALVSLGYCAFTGNGRTFGQSGSTWRRANSRMTQYGQILTDGTTGWNSRQTGLDFQAATSGAYPNQLALTNGEGPDASRYASGVSDREWQNFTGGNWQLCAGYATPNYAGTVTDWDNTGWGSFLRKNGRLVTLNIGLRAGANGVSAGSGNSLLMALPAGFWPKYNTAVTVNLYNTAGEGWGGKKAVLQVNRAESGASISVTQIDATMPNGGGALMSGFLTYIAADE